MTPSLLRRLFRLAGDLLAPRTCGLCDQPAPLNPCPACAAKLAPRPPLRALDGVDLHAAQPYLEPVSLAVRRFKYERRVDLAPTLGGLVAPLGAADFSGAPFSLVPVPLHPLRLAERGYNQAALLAHAIADEWAANGTAPRVQVAARALARCRATGQQARRGRSERLAALEGAFRVTSPTSLAGQRVVLVDDVVTSGATARGCVAALRAAGAEVVGIFAVCVAGGAAQVET